MPMAYRAVVRITPADHRACLGGKRGPYIGSTVKAAEHSIPLYKQTIRLTKADPDALKRQAVSTPRVIPIRRPAIPAIALVQPANANGV